MKNNTFFIWVFMLFNFIFLFGQTIDNCKIYDISLSNRFAKSQVKTEISFNFKTPHSSFENMISKLDTFNKNDIVKITESLSDTGKKETCTDVDKLLSDLGSKPYKKDQYKRVKYSKPFFISNKRVVLFLEVLNKHKDFSGVKGGGIIMEIYTLKKNKLKFVDKKVLEVY